MIGRLAVACCAVVALTNTAGCARSVERGSVTVFAASSLTDSFEQIAAAFEAENPGVDVVITSAGSNTLAAQITEGAPADVFASADAATIEPLIDDGLVASPQVFARNRLEIAVEPGNPYDIDGMYALGRERLSLAICAPEVPCGAYTAQMIENSGEPIEPTTLETSVAAVVTKVLLGEVDAGIVYHTDIVANDGLEGIEINTGHNVSADYVIAAVTNGDDHSSNSGAFIDFVVGDRGQQILGDAGFEKP